MSDPTIDLTDGSRPEASAVAWSWRSRAAGAVDARAREARANRIRGVSGAAVGLAFAALLHYFHKDKSADFVLGIAVAVALLALASPLGLYKSLTRTFDKFARIVASAVTWVLMAILFYLVFLPTGLVLRAGKRLAITKGADRRLPSYWTPTEGRQPPLESYRRQF